MDDKFRFIIKEKLKLTLPNPIVIGFSGGIDSVCLATLFTRTTYPVILAHFNHCLRETADYDEEFSKNFAQERNLPFFSEKGDVKKYASIHTLSAEEAARKMRYEFLFRIAEQNNSNHIAVGHHADDQVETVFMHLLRGSGMAGLTGMKLETFIPEFHKSISIIRPLLIFWREEIEEYCRSQGLDFVQDETNFSDTYERNRIRNKILPFLKNLYPGVNERIFKLSSILGEEDTLLHEVVREKWAEVCIQDHSEFVRIDRRKFNFMNKAIQRRIIRHAYYLINPSLRNLSFENVERILTFSVSQRIGEIDIQSNILAFMNEHEIILGPAALDWIDHIYPQLKQNITINLSTNKSVSISDFWKLEIELLSHQPDINDLGEGFVANLDADYFQNDLLMIRTRKNGDRFQPLGMQKGHIKISDFFINKKLIKVARDNWPLVTTVNDEIVWIPGFLPNHSARITSSTKNIIKISLHKLSD